MSKTWKIILGVIAGIFVLFVGCGIIVAVVIDDAVSTIDVAPATQPSFQSDSQSQPASSDPSGTVRVDGVLFYCSDLTVEYRTMSAVGQDTALMHLSNVMNLEAMESGNALTHISIGEAERALKACQ